MKRLLILPLALLLLTLAGCGSRHRTNQSVTIGYVNWRTSVIDSAASDSMTALANDSATHLVLQQPDVKVLKRNPITTICQYVTLYYEAPDSLVATDSLALARPELADSIKNAYDSDDRNLYINRKMGVNSAETLFNSSLLIAISALVLLIFLISKIYKVFIRSPFKTDEED
ncbi:MAG: hypothetical protein ACI308_01125 [Muribaculaceae bacterium]